MGSQDGVVTLNGNIIMQGTQKDPKFITSMNIVVAQASTDNVDRLMENVEHHKEKMLKLKDTLVKRRGEGIELKRKHDAILSEKEIIQRKYQDLESEKDSLDVQVIIMEGEKKDFEARILELESRRLAVSQLVGELKTKVEELLA